MAILIFDAAGSNVDGTDPGTALNIGPGGPYRLRALSISAPPQTVQYAGSVDTEGSRRVSAKHENRVLNMTIMCDTLAALQTLQGKIGKIARESGTAKWTLPNATADVVIVDLLAVDTFEPVFDVNFQKNQGAYCDVQIALPMMPYGRGAEIDLGDNVETTLPVLIFTDTGVKGDIPGLARLVIDEDQGVDQMWVTWAVQSRYYDSASSAALFYEAEGRTALGGASVVTGAAGASGGASNNVVRQATLTLGYQAMLSTQATGAGAHLSHVGTFHAWARVYTGASNLGTTTVALEWAAGDFARVTRNDATDIPPLLNATFQLVDLGLVSIPKTVTGTQQWEGRIIAKGTTLGDDLDVDWLLFVPVDESSGTLAATVVVPSPTSFTARDEFDQSAGALATKVAPAGGTWTSSGDATDFAVEATGHTAQRSVTTDTGVGRLGRLGAGTAGLVALQVDFKQSALTSTSASTAGSGLLARYVDGSNYARFAAFNNGGLLQAECILLVAGTTFVITIPSGGVSAINDQWYTLRAITDTGGRYWIWLYRQGTAPGTPQAQGVDSRLATGGTLASGGYGIWDLDITTVNTRNYDNFAVWTPTMDAAICASQSLQVGSSRVDRENAAGTLWAPAVIEGEYLTIPPAGPEGRTVRTVVKVSRNAPGFGPDSGTDDISAQLFYTPRYLVVPSP